MSSNYASLGENTVEFPPTCVDLVTPLQLRAKANATVPTEIKSLSYLRSKSRRDQEKDIGNEKDRDSGFFSGIPTFLSRSHARSFTLLFLPFSVTRPGAIGKKNRSEKKPWRYNSANFATLKNGLFPSLSFRPSFLQPFRDLGNRRTATLTFFSLK